MDIMIIIIIIVFNIIFIASMIQILNMKKIERNFKNESTMRLLNLEKKFAKSLSNHEIKMKNEINGLNEFKNTFTNQLQEIQLQQFHDSEDYKHDRSVKQQQFESELKRWRNEKNLYDNAIKRKIRKKKVKGKKRRNRAS